MHSKFFCFAALCALSTISVAQPDYPGAIWDQADPGNFTVATRPTSHPIKYVILHITEGSYNSAISWFNNPASNVSAHFVMRSSDGQATQMVRIKDIGYHAGNWTINTQSIGIEHEGLSSSPSWWTPQLYRASTDLSRYFAKLYNIPRTRQNFLMHREVSSTGCPGPYFNVDYYLKLVMLHAEVESITAPSTVTPGGGATIAIQIKNSGDLPWQGRGGNRVELVTANPSAHASAFAMDRWLTTSVPVAVTQAVAPGASYRFRFPISIPNSAGTISESFQMRYIDGTYFGPIITVTFNSTQNDIAIDNTSPNFSVTGTWNTGNTAAGRYGNDYRWHDTVQGGTDTASWFLDAPSAGNYDVYCWYPAGTNRTTQASYRVQHSTGTAVISVNQQVNGGQWNLLGRYNFNAGSGFVKLVSGAPAGSVVIADAVRLVGPF